MERIVSDPKEKQWGMFAHLAAFSMFIGIPLGNIIGPLIIYLIKKDEMEFVNDQGKEALNFNITWALILFASAIFIIIGIGILMLIGFGIAWMVFVIIAAVKANEGVFYRYPLTIKFIK